MTSRIMAWARLGKREYRSCVQQRIEEVIESFNLDRAIWIAQLGNQDRSIDEHDDQNKPCAEVGSRRPPFLTDQHQCSGNEQNRARQIADDLCSWNPLRHELFQRDAWNIRRMQKVLHAVKHRRE